MDKRVNERISTKSQLDEMMFNSEPALNYNPNVLKQYLTENVDHKDQTDKNGAQESNILVALRVRPIIQKEIEKGDFNIVRTEDNLIVNFQNFTN